MSLKQRLQDDLIRAMREKDEVRKRTLRMALAAVKYREKEVRGELSDGDVVVVLRGEAKQRREMLEELAKAGRLESLASEQADLDVLKEYLPSQLSQEEIADLARQVIDDLNAEGPRQTGQVMGALMAQVKGRADGKVVNQVVRKLLGN